MKNSKNFLKSMKDSFRFTTKTLKDLFHSKLSKLIAIIVVILFIIYFSIIDIAFIFTGMILSLVMYKHYINKYLNNYRFANDIEQDKDKSNIEVLNFDLVENAVVIKDTSSNTYSLILSDVVSLSGHSIEEITIKINYEEKDSVNTTINAFDDSQIFIFRIVKEFKVGSTLSIETLIDLINENC